MVALDIGARLGEIAIFAELPARARTRLIAVSRICDLAAGETSNALEPGGSILFVLSGRLRSSALADGSVSYLDHQPGEDFGLAAALAGQEVSGRALLCLEPAVAAIVPAAAALAALRSSAPAAFAAASTLAARLLAAPLQEPGPLQLVFRDLLRSARPTGESRWTLDPMPRHRELAARAGVSEESAAAAIAHLVRLGVARRRYPALDIEDHNALQRLAG
jgi:CRP/FNR family transcriptional regulator, cyclic AMP receptor protein